MKIISKVYGHNENIFEKIRKYTNLEATNVEPCTDDYDCDRGKD